VDSSHLVRLLYQQSSGPVEIVLGAMVVVDAFKMTSYSLLLYISITVPVGISYWIPPRNCHQDLHEQESAAAVTNESNLCVVAMSRELCVDVVVNL
jgi:hypothetical protein